MRTLLSAFTGRREPARRFFERFAGRSLIVHAGLSMVWLDELLKQGGGAGHFRIDARRPPGPRPTPVEWLVHTHVLKLALPLPLLLKVDRDRVRLRHLQRHGGVCDPGEIGWLLDDMAKAGRTHAVLYFENGGWRAEPGIAVEDNDYDIEP